MLFAQSGVLRFSLFASTLAALTLAGTAALAQYNPALPGGQTPRPGTPAQPQRNGPVFISPMFGSYGPGSNPTPIRPFGTYDPTRAATYGTYRYNPTDNEVHHYTSPLSPFASYQPRYQPYFNRYKPSNYSYANGVYTNGVFDYGWAGGIFPDGAAYYPYYVPGFISGATYFSPYSYYVQTTPSFILADTVYQAPPQVIYVPVPVYVDGAYHGEKHEDIDDYYLNRAPKQDDEPTTGGKTGATGSDRAPVIAPDSATKTARLIDRAAADIAKAWKDRDIQTLSGYIDAKAKVAIYLRGKYQYSLDARDYLDLTRDAFQATKTVKFELDAPVRKERGVYLLTGKHTYQNKDGAERTVHINYVLELKDDKYQITQVGSAPDKVEEYKVGE